MKQYISIILAFIGSLLFGGCDYLDYDESSYLTREDVFSEYSRAESYLTNIYTQLPADWGTVDGAIRACGVDEAVHVNSLSNVRKFNDGTWSAINTVDGHWSGMYSGIYDVNLFLSEIEGETWEELMWNEDYPELMEQFEMYPYEARYLRAYFYFELLRRYGGVPIVKTELSAEEANSVIRASFDELVDYIVSECDAIIEVLPVTFDGFSNNSETGRATKGAAMALKARTLLYAASPLHNTSNDINKWQAAAQANYAIIDSAWYSLEGNYNNVVNKGNSSELIFEKRQDESNDFEIKNFPIGYEGGNTGTCPTQNLVDAYEMQSTGLSIDDPSSGYDNVNPYSGRDPRLAKTVIVNGSSWKGQSIEVWYGGANAEPKYNATKTGYYLKKYVIESVNLETGNISKKRHTWVYFRLGEVLLNFAEAMNEAYGPENNAGYGMTALQAVNQLRSRAGMPDFPSGMSADEFRTKLRNERRVELAFEDHRFWDVRRWKIGADIDINGMHVELGSEGEYIYRNIDVETRVWNERMNLFPIPQTELYKNSNLTQNPGW
ncbi:RagB/SusD family nutrient uptake outer membrane protein [Marinifilum caeruleilacunae]|uniref:RagB/SusD family nutrient uptake outer membrane protein n=1 Tax=Marinifilum caeruleilacunae TaxID=2499076 RepID=A0ABX1X0Y4_9BACT|nr:RagB/SusD family nutrient uptake outer membrane protein [Marinifilum caeruleilacunae]NOU61763.1 RagB/SusD family nutrient uptake outer membrane protein [Marinifilum caeruleilacunae]